MNMKIENFQYFPSLRFEKRLLYPSLYIPKKKTIIRILDYTCFIHKPSSITRRRRVVFRKRCNCYIDVKIYDRKIYDRKIYDRKIYDRKFYDRKFYDRKIYDRKIYDRI